VVGFDILEKVLNNTDFDNEKKKIVGVNDFHLMKKVYLKCCLPLSLHERVDLSSKIILVSS